MGRTVVIAEKPSVGRDIARVLGCQSSGRGCLTGGDWVVTWAVGHLVTLVEPDELDEKYKRWSFDTLPILPAEIPLKIIASSRDQFAVVRNLINAPETDRLICATDAGREGELIFRYIYEKAGCKKPFDRLWISSMTDEAIQEGFRAIRSGSDYDGLYRSAQCRSQADWLVGMNASRAFTLRYMTRCCPSGACRPRRLRFWSSGGRKSRTSSRKNTRPSRRISATTAACTSARAWSRTRTSPKSTTRKPSPRKSRINPPQ